MPKCKACGAKIVWINTAAGKMMPCDANPIPYKEDPDGSLMIVTGDGRVVKAKADAVSDEVGYISHFATCPASNDFRRRK